MLHHVFISYVKEDQPFVEKLAFLLEEEGINVWMDVKNLKIGNRWKNEIKQAIENGLFFIACFSEAYLDKDASYMNEELLIAIEQMRLRPHSRSWFLPVKIDRCEIPDRPIGGGEYLSDLQYIDLSKDFIGGISNIISVLTPHFSNEEREREFLRYALQLHIKNKIKHFTELGGQEYPLYEKEWLRLLEKRPFEFIFRCFYPLLNRCIDTRTPQHSHVLDPQKGGMLMMVSILPTLNVSNFLDNLHLINSSISSYSDLVYYYRNLLYDFEDWENRVLAHIVYCEDRDGKAMFDLLYLESFSFFLRRNNEAKHESSKHIPCMYPTTLISLETIHQICSKIFIFEYYKMKEKTSR